MRGALTVTAPDTVAVPVGPLCVELRSADSDVLHWATGLRAGARATSPDHADFPLTVTVTSKVLSGPTAPTLRVTKAGTELAYHGLRALVTPTGATALLSVAGAHVLGAADVARGQRRLANLLRLVSETVVTPTPIALHGAGIALGDRGYAFVGPRGAGKTTLSRRFDVSTRLGDDHLWVLPERDGYRLWRTPFAGREGTVSLAESAPLRAIAVMAQGRATSARRLSATDAFTRLLPAIVLPWADAAFTAGALDRIATLVQSIPIVALELTLQGPAIAAVESCL
ncbi:MAG: hypothetical protein IV100_31025 [Myxococcales bacterium]|nr:hypothetical protein [Myxococcales bacterium]